MATEMCDLPGQGGWETGFHHTVADGEAGGGVAVVGAAVRGRSRVKKLPVI